MRTKIKLDIFRDDVKTLQKVLTRLEKKKKVTLTLDYWDKINEAVIR